MNIPEDLRQTVTDRLDLQLRHGEPALDELLVASSHLPGPRANLAPVDAVVRAVVDDVGAADEQIWSLLGRWAATPTDQAPANHPREMLPLSAAAAHGAVGAAVPAYWQRALDRLREQARDARWRTREGVANGLQRMARADFDGVYRALEVWVAEGDLLEMRATAAALAEPDLVASPQQALATLTLHAAILERVRDVGAATRRSEHFKALRKGLAYTLSVVAVGCPEQAFARMREWAAWPDRDLRWVLKQNLGKGRLTRVFRDEVAALASVLER